MEIERKYLVSELPSNLEEYPVRRIQQGYLNREPVIRIRREDNDFILTYKSSGLMIREEVNLPLDAQSYESLRKKIDGKLITKKRYLIPYKQYTIELDVFSGELSPLILAEVEFPTAEEAENFTPPSWFGEDVTFDGRYHNSYLSK
ncbi:adenylate cyclase [Lachnospiraceae bacterium PFB1-21]